MWEMLDKIENQIYKNNSYNVSDLEMKIRMLYKTYDINNKIATKKNIQDFKKQIALKYDVLDEYGKMVAKKYLMRQKFSNSEIFEFMLYIIYFEYMNKLNTLIQKKTIELYKHTYDKEIEEMQKAGIIKKVKQKNYLLFGLALLNLKNASGYKWNEYINTFSRYCADEMFRNISTIGEKVIFELLVKQQARILRVKKNPTKFDNYAGSLEDELVYITNSAKKDAYNDYDIQKVQFIGIDDNKQTPMCNSLTGQIFYTNKENIYQRYSEVDKGIITYHTFGLVIGENLPPINNFNHHCRSSIVFLSEE